jgi:demethylmenaquinone methyltransferase / 2-methoxy-6-polyprenyl-1,4-benzoquinol methylase
MNKDRGKELKKYYSAIYKQYDLVNRLFTLGQDQYWRKLTAKKCLESNPSKILDLCCGTGDLSLFLSKYGDPEIQIIGYDFNPEMLNYAKSKAQAKTIKNISFTEGDAGEMPFADSSFDAITIGFGFRNLTYDNPDYQRNINEIFRVLKPCGNFFILESGAPKNSFIRFFYTIYLYVFLIPIGSLLSRNYKAYKYLAQSSSKFFTNSQLIELLSKNGYGFVSLKKFFFGAADLFLFSKKPQE